MGWTKTNDDGLVKYSVFASDIEGYSKKSKKEVRCPAPDCRREIQTQTLFQNPIAVGDEPMAMFKPVCPHCGVLLTVFND